MPQMAPLMWLNLMLMFLISFSIFFSMSYHMMIPSKMEKMTKSLKFNQKNWKW